jgi:1,4-alpha-glucan branching enzyme
MEKACGENRFLTYLEFANDLVNYVETGFTFRLPIMEYPYDPS